MNNHPKPPPPTPSSASATSLDRRPPRTITLNRPILVAAFPSPPIYDEALQQLRRGPTTAPARTCSAVFITSSSQIIKSQMYRFTVHFVHKTKTKSSLWTPSVYTFGHNNPEICKSWVNQINAYLNVEAKRPKSLLVFVHPRSGKGQGCRIWEAVAPLFSRAKVKTKSNSDREGWTLRDVLASITNRVLSLYDGVIAVGGDGFFNEILNGVLLSRHKAPYPPTPADSMQPVENELNVSTHNVDRAILEPCDHNRDDSPLLTGSEHVGPRSPNCEQDPEFHFPNEMFRFGIIPAGSTDAIVICTTGARDPVTSALHVILGKRVDLDIAQVVRWKETHASNEEPCVRYAASFAGLNIRLEKMLGLKQLIASNGRIFWGWLLLITGSFSFVCLLYAAVKSKLLPPRDNAIIRAIQNDCVVIIQKLHFSFIVMPSVCEAREDRRADEDVPAGSEYAY
ncbi:hypothetical protein CASFOL_002401 [Castilleja foliolosa]|uniref:DAGKc domain-containing protein n=1 Tax=Castilleja foliolosa TaxID=1961234 RepID=A0ABD3EHW8_9LAMI